MTGILGCARTESGRAAVAAPTRGMNSRRFMQISSSKSRQASRVSVLDPHRIGVLHRNRAALARTADTTFRPPYTTITPVIQ